MDTLDARIPPPLEGKDAIATLAAVEKPRESTTSNGATSGPPSGEAQANTAERIAVGVGLGAIGFIGLMVEGNNALHALMPVFEPCSSLGEAFRRIFDLGPLEFPGFCFLVAMLGASLIGLTLGVVQAAKSLWRSGVRNHDR
jgi:hypothetical protein